MQTYKMLIGGKWVEAESGKTYTVVNPATEEKIGQAPLGDKADVDKAVVAARKAFPIWSSKTQDERSKILKQIASSIRKHSQELVDIYILDHGSPIVQSSRFIQSVANHFDNAAEVAKNILGVGEIRPLPNSLTYFKREPIGVCALIIPWNEPLMLSVKIAGALSVGNTCVVKPPSVDTLPILKFAEILEENGITPGAVNVVTGPGGTVGEALASVLVWTW